MSKVVGDSLQKIAKGSTIVLVGTVISLLLGFLSRIILVRFTTQKEFGIYTIALTIVTICVTLAMFGLQDGAARNIAFLRGRKEYENVKETIYSAILISLITSFLVTFIIIIFSNYISTEIYSIPEISSLLQILSISIPFNVILNVLISIFRGFDNARVRVYYDYIFRPASYFLLLGLAVFLHMSFSTIVLTYVVSIVVTFLIVILYFFKSCPNKIKYSYLRINKNTKELIRYSFPLLTVSILLMVLSWTDVLMLGYFKTAEVVGTYSAIYPIAALLCTGVNSLGYLYVPIISRLYSENQVQDIGKINEISTKWSFIVTVPIFFVIYVFPEFLVSTLYDYRYVEASNILQILALGFMMNSFFGLNYYTLMATGKANFLMICSSVSAGLNIILNLILIPKYGMVGAALAFIISYTTIEMYMTLKLYKFLKIHPFSSKYLRVIFVSILSIGIFYIFRSLAMQGLFQILEYFFLFLITYFILIFLMKSMDKEDIQILQNVKNLLRSLVLKITPS